MSDPSVSRAFSWIPREMNPKFQEPVANMRKGCSYTYFVLDHFYQMPSLLTSNNFHSATQNTASKRSASWVWRLPTVFCSVWNLIHQLKQIVFLFFFLIIFVHRPSTFSTSIVLFPIEIAIVLKYLFS